MSGSLHIKEQGACSVQGGRTGLTPAPSGGGLLHPPQDHTGCLHPHEEIREILQVGKGTSKRYVQETNRDDLGENLTMRKTNPL